MRVVLRSPDAQWCNAFWNRRGRPLKNILHTAASEAIPEGVWPVRNAFAVRDVVDKRRRLAGVAGRLYCRVESRTPRGIVESDTIVTTFLYCLHNSLKI